MKKKGTKQSSNFRKNLTRVFGGFFLFVLIFPMLFGEMGFLQYVKIQKTQQNLVLEIERLERENEELQARISRLRSDPETIERLARESLGLVRPGEVVFQLQESRQKSRNPDP